MNFKHIDKFFMMIKYVIKILIPVLEMKFYVVCMGTTFIYDYTWLPYVNVIYSHIVILFLIVSFISQYKIIRILY